VSGPELKSKWVGESEENLRQIFHKGPPVGASIIVFDELDSFARHAAPTPAPASSIRWSTSFLTEMDGFHRDEMVFVVGTTNYVSILDPALLPPGRFEFHLHIPYPDAEARREILRIYDRKMGLKMTPGDAGARVDRTTISCRGRRPAPCSAAIISTPCAGHRPPSAARDPHGRNRPGGRGKGLVGVDRSQEADRSRGAGDRQHEAGHAVCALLCPHAEAIKRIA